MVRACVIVAALLVAGVARADEAAARKRVCELGGRVVVRPNGDVWVELGGTRAGDDDLAGLGEIGRLRLIDLNSTRVTDAGMKVLGRLRGVETLWMPNTAITDAGLKELAGLTGLRMVEARGTKVTAAGAWGLQKSLPRCDVTFTRPKVILRAPAVPGPAVTPERPPALRIRPAPPHPDIE